MVEGPAHLSPTAAAIMLAAGAALLFANGLYLVFFWERRRNRRLAALSSNDRPFAAMERHWITQPGYVLGYQAGGLMMIAASGLLLWLVGNIVFQMAPR